MTPSPPVPATAECDTPDQKMLLRWAAYMVDPTTDYPPAVKHVARCFQALAEALENVATQSHEMASCDEFSDVERLSWRGIRNIARAALTGRK
jgi:hypothetical protein